MGSASLDVKKLAKVASVKGFDLSEIFSENVVAKVIQVAQRGSKQQAPLTSYPHTVPQEGPSAGRYEEREASFWTCGFFPGCIYALLERATWFPQAIDIPDHVRPQLQAQLLKLGRQYGVAINQMSSRTDTHDMGFIVQPALQKDWELTGNKESLQSVVNAAYALASRYDERVGAIRSWDVAVNDRYSITDMEENFLVIIDSMCNLDLLYSVAHTLNDPTLTTIATTHANAIIHEILRPDHSSYHLVNFSPVTGRPLAKMTNQGFNDASTWSRGQAWAILGFAQTYTWTKDTKYLATSIHCAEYFLRRCSEGEGKWHHPLVPVWDFDAEQEDVVEPLRDVSAGVVAANGLLVVYQALQALPSREAEELSTRNFLDTALRIVRQTLDMAYDGDLAAFEVQSGDGANGVNDLNGVNGVNEVNGGGFNIKESGFECLLRHSTTNWNEHAHRKYKDHGLVYADYFLLEFGNKLLRAGLL